MHTQSLRLRRLGQAIGALAMSMALAAAGRAQGNELLRQPASIPTELATALLGVGGLGGDAQILVGEMPGWVAARLPLPKRAEVLGSAFFGTTAVSVVKYPSDADTVLRIFERELLPAGWKAAPPMPQYGGGFRPSTADPVSRSSRMLTLCGEGRAILMVAPGRQRSGSTTVTLRHMISVAPGYSPCSPATARPAGFERSPFPVLYNPPNTETGMAQCYAAGSSVGSSSTGTRLRTAMTPEVILEHYGKQLQDSGWAPEVLLPPASVSRVWVRRDSAGATSRATLTVASMPRDSLCRTVGLEVSMPRAP